MREEKGVKAARPQRTLFSEKERPEVTCCRRSLTAAPEIILLREYNYEKRWGKEEKMGVREGKLKKHVLFKAGGFKALLRAKGKGRRLLSNARS